ncbi:ImmA/IrrE family metallo-endopeptidase [Sporosarcina psychrophila]|uniref:IrrE N-terminal-like domain-containing protein n=1 Tax=Sporosarcina psychrophila TaxID=1476 RepID=A0ABV2KAL7_SPOPS
MRYDTLVLEYPQLLIIEVKDIPKGLAGLYTDNMILIDKYRGRYEKHCILAEEIGHHETTYGDITNLKNVRERKLELVARRWGYEKIVSLDKLIECYEMGYKSLEEVCTHLEITASYLKKSVDHYSSRHGISIHHNGYRIGFDPLYIRRV